jgi:hypothetical protein
MWPGSRDNPIERDTAGGFVARFHFALKPISSLLKVCNRALTHLLSQGFCCKPSPLWDQRKWPPAPQLEAFSLAVLPDSRYGRVSRVSGFAASHCSRHCSEWASSDFHGSWRVPIGGGTPMHVNIRCLLLVYPASYPSLERDGGRREPVRQTNFAQVQPQHRTL